MGRVPSVELGVWKGASYNSYVIEYSEFDCIPAMIGARSASKGLGRQTLACAAGSDPEIHEVTRAGYALNATIK